MYILNIKLHVVNVVKLNLRTYVNNNNYSYYKYYVCSCNSSVAVLLYLSGLWINASKLVRLGRLRLY